MDSNIRYFWKDVPQSNYTSNERFNLLLLEPGEIYFEDYSVYYYPGDLKEIEAIKRRQKGRLKVCSKSILFDPLDPVYPILKFLYRDIINIGKWSGSVLSRLEQIGEVMTVESKLYISMKEGNVLAPYKYNKGTQKHYFSLNFGNTNGIIPQVEQLLRAYSLNPHESAKMISTIVDSRQARTKFNTSWIEDLYEKIIHETTASKITPLVCNPGRILLTCKQVYFQPFNNVETKPVIKIHLSEIKEIKKRRYLLQHVGLELFYGTKNALYFTFSNSEERNIFYDRILEQEELQLIEDQQENMTLKWQSGALSNFDYLVYLNSIAYRSFNDLTQYPVFPWIIKDYTSKTLDLEDANTFRDLSKPIGALDEQRLKQLKERCKGMPEPKFLYGSHYSTPGFVLYYLVRVAPEYMLCLQNGKFDKPDRLFNSLFPTWTNCCTGHSDYKEVLNWMLRSTGKGTSQDVDVKNQLIPEFYDSDGSFLCNSHSLNLGRKQDGTVVHDVELPPWAKDANDFILKCREALESDYVSQRLHHWIDLIFGYQQTGEEAWKADNVFYYLTYEGALDLESIANENERKCMEAQILEFGQTPKQLFTKPHPMKQISKVDLHSDKETETDGVVVTDEAIVNDIPVVKLTEKMSSLATVKVQDSSLTWTSELKLKSSCKLHKDSVLDVKIFDEKDLFVSVGQDSQMKLFTGCNCEQQRSMNLSNMSLSCCAILDDGNYIAIGSWDNNIYTYSVEFSRIVDQLQAHHDAVSSLCCVNDMLASSSWDSTVKLWKCDFSNKKCSFTIEEKGSSQDVDVKNQGEFDHDTEVICCCLYYKDSSYQLISGTKDGCILLWNVEMQMQMFEINLHSDSVTTVLFSPDGSRILSVSEDCHLRVVDSHTEVEVYSKHIGEGISCACWDGHLVLLGCTSGNVMIWDLVKDTCIKNLQFHQGSVRCLTYNNTTQRLCTGGEDGRVAVWTVNS